MNSMAGRNRKDEQQDFREEKGRYKLQIRKAKLQEIVRSKRNLPSQPKVHMNQHHNEPEVKEVIPEESGKVKGYLDLSKHKSKKPRRSKKKCWICKSDKHFKRNCNKIKCFYCSKKGHIKKDCQKKKMNLIFNGLSEIYGKYIEQYKKRHIKIQDYIDKIYSTKYQREGKSYKVIWNNTQVGEYFGPGKPTPFEKLEHDPINYKFIDATLKTATPYERLKLFDGLSNTCACGVYGLKKKDFLNHVKTIHNGIALPKSYLNRPPWYEWIFFYSDEAEEIFTSINIS